jgi:hypothetical protein
VEGKASAFYEKNQLKQFKEIEKLIGMYVEIVKNHPFAIYFL